MGRLSAYAKNRILKLRFKKNKRIIHIVEILKRDDDIKVSRQAVSTFLKKYLETNSIYDKPRTGRKRKLTQEEIQLIGQVTRLNRDITARAIKEYLNLNVSTYTILRATKLFEWNKINPNSNDSKKAAALERQLNGEVDVERRRSRSVSSNTGKSVSNAKRKSSSAENMNDIINDTFEDNEKDEHGEDLADVKYSNLNESLNTNENGDDEADGEVENVNKKKVKGHLRNESQNEDNLLHRDDCEAGEDGHNTTTEDMASQLDEIERIQNKLLINYESSKANEEETFRDNNGKKASLSNSKKMHKISANAIPELEKTDLHLIEHKELLALKNLSCSPMSFATKILFKIFKIEELHGHNVSGKTLNKNLKNKLPLDSIRVGYIKFLVESYYDDKECKEMLSGALTHKQDLWRSCHTAINKSILISERKAAMNLTAASNTTTSPNESLNLNASNLTTSENDSLLPPAKKKRKSKYDADIDLNSSSSDGNEDIHNYLPKSLKKSNGNKLEIDSAAALARNRASHVSGSSKQTPNKQQLRRRFKSDDSSSGSSLFDGELVSEEFDSNNEEANVKQRGLKKIKEKHYKKATKEISKRAKRSIDDDDTSDSNDDDDDWQHEIELIQNIEKRLLNSNTKSSNKLPINMDSEVIVNNKLPIMFTTPKENKAPSTEASAAANIAAAMKKRIVVIGVDEETQLADEEEENQANVTAIAVTNTRVGKTGGAALLKNKISSSAKNDKNISNVESKNPDKEAASRQQSTRPSRITSMHQVKTKTSNTNQIVKKETESPQTSKKNSQPKKTQPSMEPPKNNQIPSMPTASNEKQRITRSSTKK